MTVYRRFGGEPPSGSNGCARLHQGGMEVSLTGIAPEAEPLIRHAGVDLLHAAARSVRERELVPA